MKPGLEYRGREEPLPSPGLPAAQEVGLCGMKAPKRAKPLQNVSSFALWRDER